MCRIVICGEQEGVNLMPQELAAALYALSAILLFI
jgi:hypothetical protein